MVRYRYDGWGKQKVMNPDGSENESSTFLGNINPIRYRGYYYDIETGLYYLKTRYYDPEIGRFITIDDTSYLAPDTINGLNLYVYCGNNPVMNVDPEGTSWWSSLWNGIGNFFNTIGRGFTKIFSGIGHFFGSLFGNNNDFGFGFDIDIDFRQKNLFERFMENLQEVQQNKKYFFKDILWDKVIVPAWSWLNGDKWYQKLIKNVGIGIIGGIVAAGVVYFVPALSVFASTTLGLTLLGGVVTGIIGGLVSWLFDLI